MNDTAAARDTTGVGRIAGRVIDPVGLAAAGVRICVLDTPLCATSGPDGTFRINGLRSGSYRLEVLPAEGLPFATDPVEVRAGVEGAVEVALPGRRGPRAGRHGDGTRLQGA